MKPDASTFHYWLEARETNADEVTIYLHRTKMGAIMRSSDPTIDEDVTTRARSARDEVLPPDRRRPERQPGSAGDAKRQVRVMRPRKDPTRYLIVARDPDGRWHNVHLGTLTPKQATQRHIAMLHRGARPDNCQIWTKAQWLTYDSEETSDIDVEGE
ncbi:MAG: hypothetical protein ACLQUT_06440 [Thermoleophilia bacterium]